MKHPLYTRLFPGTRISASKDTEFEIATTAGGFHLATSVGGTLTGRGGNFIIIDDPLKPQDAQSDVARENLKNWYGHTLLSRLDNKKSDAIVIVMQRLHADDLIGHVMGQGDWRLLELPAIAEVDQRIPIGTGQFYRRPAGEILHPEREPLSILNDLKRNMGSADFSAQYQQQPVPPGGNMIKWDWFKTYDHWPPFEREDKLIVSWDTAMSARELADYSVCVILHVRDETMWLLQVIRERLEYPDLKRAVWETHMHWRRLPNYKLLIENKGSGQSLIQDLKHNDIYPIAIDPEGDKIMRMHGQTGLIEAGAIHLPQHAPWLDDFRAEMMSFPGGRHDDQVDALSQALNYLANQRGRGIVVRQLRGHY